LNGLVSKCSDDDGLVSGSFIQPHNSQVEVSDKEICTEYTGAAIQWQYSSLENGSSNAAADTHSRHISGGIHDETAAEMNGVARRNGLMFSATYSAITDGADLTASANSAEPASFVVRVLLFFKSHVCSRCPKRGFKWRVAFICFGTFFTGI
jgi:hypothetical protein